MSNHVFQKSIAATLGMAIASTSFFYSMSSQAQSGATGTTTAPGKDSMIMSPSKSGSIGQPIPTPKKGGMSQAGTAPAKKMTKKTIVDVAASDKRFSTLVTALKAADLVETLSGEGPFTDRKSVV